MNELQLLHARQLLQAYLAARYVPAARDAWRLRVGRRASTLEAAFPQVRRYALITAWNPASRRASAEQNAACQVRLKQEIQAAGARWIDAANGETGSEWYEPSLLIFDLALEHVDRLAWRHGQNAVLRWERGRAVRLRLYGEGWTQVLRQTHMDTRFIESVACVPA